MSLWRKDESSSLDECVNQEKNGLAEWLMLYLSTQMEFRANLLKIEYRACQNGQCLLVGTARNVALPGS